MLMSFDFVRVRFKEKQNPPCHEDLESFVEEKTVKRSNQTENP